MRKTHTRAAGAHPFGANVSPWLVIGASVILAAAVLVRPRLYRGLVGALRAVDPGLKRLSRLPGLAAFARSRAVPRLRAPLWSHCRPGMSTPPKRSIK